jgi:hypothetical protein
MKDLPSAKMWLWMEAINLLNFQHQQKSSMIFTIKLYNWIGLAFVGA